MSDTALKLGDALDGAWAVVRPLLEAEVGPALADLARIGGEAALLGATIGEHLILALLPGRLSADTSREVVARELANLKTLASGTAIAAEAAAITHALAVLEAALHVALALGKVAFLA